MVNSCAAYNCTQRHEKGISFHEFPKDEYLRKKWIIAMKREKWKPSKSSQLCCKHFTDDDYETYPWSMIKKLKKDAVPSVFDFPTHLNKPKSKRPPPKKRNPVLRGSICHSKTVAKEANILSNSDNVEHSSPVCSTEILPDCDNAENFNADVIMEIISPNCDNSGQLSTGSFSEEPPIKKRKRRECYVGDFSKPGDKAFNKAKEAIAIKSKLLKLERRKVARLTRKISKLEELVDHLKKKFATPDVATQALLV